MLLFVFLYPIFLEAKTAANLAIISHRTMHSDVNYHEKGVLNVTEGTVPIVSKTTYFRLILYKKHKIIGLIFANVTKNSYLCGDE